ncbi:MAG: Mpo1-like protein [Pyrinomonadaceae bacterium]
MIAKPRNYSEFWDFYVAEHSRPGTRWLRFAGTLLGISLLLYFVTRGQWYYFPAAMANDSR